MQRANEPAHEQTRVTHAPRLKPHEMTLLPTTLNTPERGTSTAVTDEATLGSVWRAAGGSEIGDEPLEWPPDVFLLTNVLLERSEARPRGERLPTTAP
jgi:hypothetical protein